MVFTAYLLSSYTQVTWDSITNVKPSPSPNPCRLFLTAAECEDCVPITIVVFLICQNDCEIDATAAYTCT
jgi:hypothetical protein